jgi:hypothetical protein
VVAAEEAASLEAALAAAGRVGWPVALKTAAPGVHTRPRWAASTSGWPARSGSPPPTPTSPAGSARG